MSQILSLLTIHWGNYTESYQYEHKIRLYTHLIVVMGKCVKEKENVFFMGQHSWLTRYKKTFTEEKSHVVDPDEDWHSKNEFPLP